MTNESSDSSDSWKDNYFPPHDISSPNYYLRRPSTEIGEHRRNSRSRSANQRKVRFQLPFAKKNSGAYARKTRAHRDNFSELKKSMRHGAFHNMRSTLSRRDSDRSTTRLTTRSTTKEIITGIISVCFIIAVAIVYNHINAKPHRHVPPDFTDSNPGREVLVHITGYTLTDFAKILVKNDIIASEQAFIDAAGNTGISAGYYRLPQHISSSTALSALTIDSGRHKVGQFVITPGTTLLSRKDNRGRTVPGIADLLERSSCFKLNNISHCYTRAKDVIRAASTASLQQLGIPVWARASVTKLAHDPRRIEGLIYAATWDDINPQESAIAKLHDLITASSRPIITQTTGPFQDPLVRRHGPYDLVIIGSIIEREAGKESDYEKISRVIYNRLHNAEPTRLDMDSTVNYGLRESNLDFDQQNLTKVTLWNTRVIYGLPITPIGSVSAKSLYAATHPSPGKWMFFVTVDDHGTTLFAETLAEHEKNIAIGCRNHFLTTVC